MDLTGKVVLVIGGARGIGKGIAQRMARAGGRIVVADIDGVAAAASASELGDGALADQVDVLDEGSVVQLVARTVDQTGTIDVMVNTAGITLGIRSVLDTSLADFERVQRLNVTGTFLCFREVGRHMAQRRYGSMIAISSVTGRLAQRGGVSYGTSKAAVAHLTRIVAMDMAEYGVRANAIAPGPVRTPLMESHGAERMKTYVARIPLGHMAEVADVAGAALYLASDEARFTTGEVLVVDGGFTVSGLR